MSAPTLDSALAEMPVIAILRGVQPTEILAIAEVIHRAGIRIIEVPLNSPQPFDSIRRLANEFSAECVCGAGTVVADDEVDQLADVGGRIAVSPNTNVAVIRRSLERGIEPVPGWSSATDAFAAHHAGARHLKLFPAGTFGTDHLKALLAVLPPSVAVVAVGGIGVDAIDDWFAAGARGFGIGSELYRPGDTPDRVFERAEHIVTAVRRSRFAHGQD
ncbi:MAG: 2-dehydro-3-deoxy-6-phosphogalactonate aldolase [Pseudomonadota bacterium]